jgi:hypothetical protein
MKKLLVLLSITAAFLLLGACAIEQTPVATATPTEIVYATPDASQATPQVGFATVLKIEGVKAVQLRSQPNVASPLSGEVYPDEQGKLLGTDPSGQWVLVDIKGRVGWAPTQLFALTVAQ